ncbi:MAG: hypothetical protein JO250_00375, partial [Armatimonadetes bacterium]|nr:hypothetical protein [Armatimonadota bacterium]
MHRLTFVVCLALLSVAPGPPLAAQTPTAPPLRPADALYMGQGLVLTAAPPRQLTLNAHVPQFLYQPGGDSLAYVSVQTDGDRQTTSVKFVDARQKDHDTRTIYSVTGDAPEAPVHDPQIYSLDLLGWSADGRWLLIREGNTSNFLNTRFLLGDVGASPLGTRDFPQPEPPSGADFTLDGAAWSPDRRRILIARQGFRHDASVTVRATSAEVYDPSRNAAQTLAIGDGLNLLGWRDEDHL